MECLCLDRCTHLPLEVLQSGLSRLPHLTSLSILPLGFTGPEHMSAVMEGLPGQLTHLALTWEGTVVELLAAQPSAVKLRLLRRLELPTSCLDDAGLTALLTQLPGLMHVEVSSCRLESSHADAACSWQELKMAGWLATRSLIRLPLRGIQRLVVSCLMSVSSIVSSQLIMSNEMTVGPDGAVQWPTPPSPDVVAAALNCCQLHCEGHLELQCCTDELTDLLPLLAKWQGVKEVWVCTHDFGFMPHTAVAVLGVLLRGLPSCTLLRLDSLVPHPSALLLPALARTAVSTVYLDHDHFTETQLAQWCAGQAGHPVHVVVTEHCEVAGRVAHIQDALAAVGADVTLEFRSEVYDADFNGDDDGDDDDEQVVDEDD